LLKKPQSSQDAVETEDFHAQFLCFGNKSSAQAAIKPDNSFIFHRNNPV
jgi:hypothetical protein